MSNRCPPVIQIPGVAGSNAFAFVTANFTIPAIGSNVQIQLSNTAPFIAGEDIIIAGPANFQIVSVDNPSQITAKFLGLAGDLISGAVISIGAEVSPTGMPGTNGLAGNNGYATTTSNFTVPSVGSTVVVPVNYSVPFVVGEYAIAPGPANFLVTALPSPTQVTLQFLGNTGDVSPGATIASASTDSFRWQRRSKRLHISHRSNHDSRHRHDGHGGGQVNGLDGDRLKCFPFSKWVGRSGRNVPSDHHQQPNFGDADFPGLYQRSFANKHNCQRFDCDSNRNSAGHIEHGVSLFHRVSLYTHSHTGFHYLWWDFSNGHTAEKRNLGYFCNGGLCRNTA